MEFELFGMTLRLEVVVVCVIIGYLIGAMMLCSCSKVSLKEGLTMIAPALLDSAAVPSGPAPVTPGSAGSSVYAGLEGNKGGPVPLPEGQLDFFFANKFDPACCDTSSYSSSTGCPCTSPEQMAYLNERAGNRTLAPSEY